MELRILINTHERPKKLLRLLKQLYPQTKKHNTKYFIQNDASLKNYDDVLSFFKEHLDGEIVRFPQRHGKHHYWRLVNRLFQKLDGDDFDYAFKLDDDILVRDDFIGRMIDMFEAIDNDAKVALNPMTSEKNIGSDMWTSIKAKFEEHGEYEFYHVGWVDMVWIANPLFFKTLDYKIKPIDPKSVVLGNSHSSGVGRQISWRISRSRKALYQCVTAQIYHGKHESVMHTERRRNGTHLVTNNRNAFEEE